MRSFHLWRKSYRVSKKESNRSPIGALAIIAFKFLNLPNVENKRFYMKEKTDCW
jgi:hypothetical protein